MQLLERIHQQNKIGGMQSNHFSRLVDWVTGKKKKADN